MVEDLGRRTRINPRAVFALGWSSGGPAAYAAALDEGSPIRGVFAAMSVFKPETLPPLKNAEAKAFYLWHSPRDRVCPFRMAEAAKAQLTAAGAAATLVTYEGGHGWRGDIFGALRTGVAWLAENAAGDPEATTP